MRQIAAILIAISVFLSVPAVRGTEIPIIDAHSQADHELNFARIIPLMARAGVARTILAARGRVTPGAIIDFAAGHRDRITLAVRTKGHSRVADLEQQIAMREFGAMAEVILWHAQKGSKAPENIVSIESEQAQAALSAALQRKWPFIAHYEFAAAGEAYPRLMAEFEAAAAAHRPHPFVLIHMGQLRAEEAGRLIAAHPNVYFLTSHANPISVAQSRQPWTNLFAERTLAPAWRDLVVRHSDRFILAFDNVWAEHWGDFYLEQVAVWREALADLPADVAHALAHRNAEKLWGLPPAELPAPPKQ